MPTAVAQQTVMSDPHESRGKGVQQKSADEFLGAQAHDLELIAVGIVAPSKAYLAVFEADQAMVSDGHAVGVATEISEHLFGTGAEQAQLTAPIGLRQVVQVLASEYF